MEELELINRIIAILGDAVSLADVKTWLEVEENARQLRAEGHEEEAPN